MRNVRETIKSLPLGPGVYIYRNSKGKIIYIGKAISLRHRVSQYFQDARNLDAKTRELVRNIAKIEHINTDSEVEALILEAELIKRYKPKFNVQWRDDKNYVYIKITDENYPQVSLVRQIVDDKARYIGPFVSAGALRQILRYTRKIFMFRHCNNMPQRVCLQYSIGNCTGPCQEYISKAEYGRNIRQMMKLFQGKTKDLEREFNREMKKAAKAEDYEKAALYRNRLFQLKKIQTLKLEKDLNSGEARTARDKALVGLRDALGLAGVPRRIECYDISNIFGKAAVGSMVVFIQGLPAKDHYRRFEIKTVKKISDYDMMKEVLRRRFKKLGIERKGSFAQNDQFPISNFQSMINDQSSKNKKGLDSRRSLSAEEIPASAGMTKEGRNDKRRKDVSFAEVPDLIIIDGGKGQLSAASEILEEDKLNLKVVSLAKRLEEIYSIDSRLRGNDKVGRGNDKGGNRNDGGGRFQKTILERGSESLYLVQRVRDEAHRFAITYHRSKRGKELLASNLDIIEGVGPKTKKKLLKEFGSVEDIRKAKQSELASIVGEKLAGKIKESL